MTTQVLVLYYSRSGSVYELAQSLAEGIEQEAAEAVLRTVAPLHQNHDEPLTDPLAGLADLEACDGLALGSPTRFGQMAAPMKAFWETTGTLWVNGCLRDKPAAVFTSSMSLHGGQESTLLSMQVPLLHHGMVLCGIPYSEPAMRLTQSGSGPYGASHVAGNDNNNPLTAEEINCAQAQGRRLAKIATALKAMR